ncbi:hypothetical protein KLP40_00680 [Hymenobacter sp. NST-14]|uniref:hypothetical protein n=1 Tax=Hymenobacter piscis TaxID=2839984 RepID=UPI001C00EA2B|nr:hypothetical protein [Hymenobacter piscis]MBT9391660.1 hypothetical protein [Hymenobacter piscis]
MTYKLPVAQHEPNAVLTQHLYAGLQQGNAVSGAGIAAAIVEQFPVQGQLKGTLADGNEQNVDLALAKIPFGAVYA